MPHNGKGNLQPIEPRFWAKVDRSGGDDACWPWTARRKDTGYGMFWIVRDGKGTVTHAHRMAWELAGNAAPEWPLVLDHRCRNRACCNPKHLRVVHQTANVTVYARRKTVARTYTEIHDEQIFP